MEDKELQPNLSDLGSKKNPLKPTEAILQMRGAYYECPDCQMVIKGLHSYYIHRSYYHNTSNVVKLVSQKRAQRPPLASEMIEALEKGISIIGARKILGGVSYPYFAKWAKILIPDKFAQVQSQAKQNRLRGRWSIGLEKLPSYKLLQRCIKGEELAPMHWANFPQKQIVRLIKYGVMIPSCYLCNFSEHRITDYRAPFLLDFIDDNRRNWKLENLRMLCYNCYFLNVTYVKGMANVDMRILLEKPRANQKEGENTD